MKLILLELIALLIHDMSDEDSSSFIRGLLRNLKPAELDLANDTIINILIAEKGNCEKGSYVHKEGIV
jgi:hypothetical protein